MIKETDYIRMLINHETTVGGLYSIYSETYPQHGKFWKDIAEEEKEHAELLKQLSDCIVNSTVKFDPDKFKPIVINESITYIQEQTLRAKSSSLPLKNALSIAMDIEKRIIDGHIFEAFKGYTAESRQIIRKLGDAVNDHFKRLEQVWQEYRYT